MDKAPAAGETKKPVPRAEKTGYLTPLTRVLGMEGKKSFLNSDTAFELQYFEMQPLHIVISTC